MKLRLFERALICALTLTLLFSVTVFSAEHHDISENVLRLHVLANSDSEEDQKLKLAVRDRILLESAELFADAETKEEVQKIISENSDMLRIAAEQCIAEFGCDYPVRITSEKTFFSSKTYESVTFPAGIYDAVRVEIGEAEGKNWWCVIFPAMCLPAAEEKDKLQEVLTEDEIKLLEQEKGYKIGFKSVEIWETLRHWLKDRKE